MRSNAAIAGHILKKVLARENPTPLQRQQAITEAISKTGIPRALIEASLDRMDQRSGVRNNSRHGVGH